jgi:hypothetical protein
VVEAYALAEEVPGVSSTIFPSKRWTVRSVIIAYRGSCVTTQIVAPSARNCRLSLDSLRLLVSRKCQSRARTIS